MGLLPYSLDQLSLLESVDLPAAWAVCSRVPETLSPKDYWPKEQNVLPQQAGTLVLYLSLSRVGSISKTYLPINFSGSPNCSSMGSILLPVVCSLAGAVNICATPPRGKALLHKGNSLTSSHDGGRRGLKANGKEV